MEKVTVTECTVKKTGEKDGRPYTIYKVKLADGRSGQSFNEFKPGEHEVEVEQGQYGLKFKSTQQRRGGGFTPRPANNKLEAMKLSVQLAAAGVIESSALKAYAEKIHQFISS